MTQSKIQPAFHTGEVSPSLYARVDLAKYHTGAATVRNFFVDYRGGLSSRNGTKYVLQCKNSASAVRLIPFQASTGVGYVLEFGQSYIRFFANGSPIVETGIAITGATKANPCVLSIANTWSVGDWIYVSGVAGMTELNGEYYIISARTAGTVTLSDLRGNSLNSSAFGTYTSGGLAQRVYTLASPYAAADLALLKFVQDVDTMIICHPSYAPQELKIITATNWTIGAITFGTTIAAPTPGSITSAAGGPGTYYYGYYYTSVDSVGQESVPSIISTAGLNYDQRQTGYTIALQFTVPAGAASANVYKTQIGVATAIASGDPAWFIGNIARAGAVRFLDSNIAPDYSIGLPVAKTPFASGNNPAVPAFINQRLFLGHLPNNPQQFYLSQPGAPYNFNVNALTQETDSITATIRSGFLNEIRAAVPMPSGLVVLSDRQAWLINGGSAGAPISATNIVAQAQSYNGISNVPPIVVNYDILYVQAKASIVRNLSYNFYTNVYTGVDITVMSSHLFYGYTILEWAYCEEPFKLVWAVRSDGTLLCLTFLKEQELVGWTHSDTSGSFKSVASITESSSVGEIDALYCVVERTVDGSTVKYIERMAERDLDGGVVDAWCVDAGIQYSGTPATSFSGCRHLAGLTVTGLADGQVITPFVMANDGRFTLPTAASKVTVGLGYTCQLKTLMLDMGEPTIQGKMKKISAVTVRVAYALNLYIGKTFTSLVKMKDLFVGNVGTASNTVVTDLVTGDARTAIDPSWDVPGQYCIQLSDPVPATILGVIPEVTVEDRR